MKKERVLVKIYDSSPTEFLMIVRIKFICQIVLQYLKHEMVYWHATEQLFKVFCSHSVGNNIFVHALYFYRFGIHILEQVHFNCQY